MVANTLGEERTGLVLHRCAQDAPRCCPLAAAAAALAVEPFRAAEGTTKASVVVVVDVAARHREATHT